MSETELNINTASAPSQLKITDMRFVDIVGAPMDCTIMRLETNQGITGYGEVRDFSNKQYALWLKRLLIGENPCDIGRLTAKSGSSADTPDREAASALLRWRCGTLQERLTAFRFTRCLAANGAIKSAFTAIPTYPANIPEPTWEMH